jgi:hypothetical protein
MAGLSYGVNTESKKGSNDCDKRRGILPLKPLKKFPEKNLPRLK